MADKLGLCRFGTFELDSISGELRKGGIRIRLESQPLRLLSALVARPGEVLTREELQAELWPENTYVEFERSLTRAINKVRTALGDSAANPRFIETLPRRGYRFVAPVTVMTAAAAEPPLSAEDTPAFSAPEPPATGPLRRTGVWVAVMATLIAGFAVVAVRQRTPEPISAVAVLPFENISGDPGQNYIADGITDQIITVLSRIRSWRVVSRTSAMHYKGKGRRLPDVAAELKVQAIVEGTVTLSGGRVRLVARLIRVPSESAAWTKTYEREAADILSVQADLARSIAAEIGAFVTPAEEKQLAGAAHRVDPELHALYLQGRVFVNEPGRDSIDRGIQALERVVEKDPGHAAAWAAMSDGWFSLSSVFLPPSEAMPKAKAAARKALSLDPSLDTAHAALGLVHIFYDWDWPAAEERFQKALELNANSAAAYRGLAFLRGSDGRTNESLQAINRAIELDPMSLWANFYSAMTLMCVRRHDEAERQARRVLEWEPRFGMMRSVLGLSLADRRKFPEAIHELTKAVESQRVPTTLAFLAQGYAQAGQTADAHRVIADLVSTANRQYVCPFEVASAYTTLGRKEEAFQWMSKAAADRADCMIWLKSEPWLEPLRSDPRYKALVRQVGFPGN